MAALSGAAALNLRLLVELGIDRKQNRLRVAARGADQVGAKAFLVFEQNLEEMFGREALMAAAQCQILSGLNKAFGPLGIFFELHDGTLQRTGRSAP